MEEILELDRELFLELNGGFRHPVMDQAMMFLTATSTWIPLYLALLYFLFKTLKKETWSWLLAIGLTILLADQITSSVMKPFFERLRPSHEPSLAGQVHIVDLYRGGRFGFASGHAANTFGIATLMWLVLRNYRPWIGLLFPWAILVGYTRIYLGVHYPGDVLAGFAVGFLCAVFVYVLQLFIKTYLNKRTRLPPGAH